MRAMSVQIPIINRTRVSRSVMTLALVLAGFGFCHPAMAAGDALDVTIQVVTPDQDIQGEIDHDIVLPGGAGAGELFHGDQAHHGAQAQSEKGAELTDTARQELNDAQESDSIEQQTQELMDQAEQTDQTVQDQEQETD